MRSHFSFPQGIAAACAVAGATTLLSNCAAQPFIAADYATNSTYAGGWSAGQNGGYGFGAWSMANTEMTSPIEAAMDRTSPFNPFGVAWALYNPEGSSPGPNPDWPGTQCVNGIIGTDISRAGRAFPNGLLPGQTFSTVISNPTDRKFFRGYTIVLSTGSDNIAYGKAGSQIEVGTFEYSTNGRWYTTTSYNTGRTTLFDTDTTTNGMQLDVSVTGTNTYHLVMTPLGNPGGAWIEDGILQTNGPINWVTYQLYNTDSNFYPDVVTDCGPDRTDFYIKSMTVQGLTLGIQKVGTDVLLSWPGIFTSFNLVSCANLGAAVWNPVLPAPTLVNNQNVVTNSIVGNSQFYRLEFQE